MKVCHPIEEINAALPELEHIGNLGNSLYLSYQNFDNRIKSIVTKNMNKYHHSLTFSGIEAYLQPCVLCTYDGETIEINKEKYKLIRKYLMSDEFNLKEGRN